MVFVLFASARFLQKAVRVDHCQVNRHWGSRVVWICASCYCADVSIIITVICSVTVYVYSLQYVCLSFLLFEHEINEFNDCKTAYQCVMKGIDGGIKGDLGAWQGNSFWDVLLSFPLKVTSESKKQVNIICHSGLQSF